jgi:M6 family metalloprotease-like protein
VSQGSAAYGKLHGPSGFTADGHGTDPARFVPAVGERRALLIPVDFPDARADTLPDPWSTVDAYVRALVPGAQAWFADASHGRLHLQVDVLPRWYRLRRLQTAYDYRRGMTRDAHAAYLADVLAQAAPDVDYAAYDVVYVVPPKNADAIPFSPAFVDHRGELAALGYTVRHAVTFGQDLWHWGFRVLNHETLHLMGLPDLYRYASDHDGTFAHPYVGGYDIMGLISGHAPAPFAWQQWRLGWIDDDHVVVAAPAALPVAAVLSPIALGHGIVLLLLKLDDQRAVAVESRRAVGVDGTAQDAGLLVYDIDASARSGAGPLRVRRPSGRPFGPGDTVSACRPVGPNVTQVWSDPTVGVRMMAVSEGPGIAVRLEAV